jgi:hypothetical protein
MLKAEIQLQAESQKLKAEIQLQATSFKLQAQYSPKESKPPRRFFRTFSFPFTCISLSHS